jgi:hypothetical protein
MGNSPRTAHSKNCCGSVTLSLVLAVFCMALPVSSAPQDTKATPPEALVSTRPCAPVITGTKPANSTAMPAMSPADPPEGGLGACLEVQATPIEIREFLQSLARQQRRTTRQQQTSSDLWTFVRHLEKEELSLYAKTDILGGRFTWREGKAFVAVKTAEVADPFIRVQITARFQGRGQTSLGFARPTDWWQLATKGTLESGMLAALESHFGSGH